MGLLYLTFTLIGYGTEGVGFEFLEMINFSCLQNFQAAPVADSASYSISKEVISRN
jgi:hypothetical protein